jgi:hypothetical protein
MSTSGRQPIRRNRSQIAHSTSGFTSVALVGFKAENASLVGQFHGILFKFEKNLYQLLAGSRTLPVQPGRTE